MRHTLSIIVADQPGELSRIVGLFSARGFNIQTISVGETLDPRWSRVTIVTRGDDRTIQQIVKQCERLARVREVQDVTMRPHIEREMALITVAAKCGRGATGGVESRQCLSRESRGHFAHAPDCRSFGQQGEGRYVYRTAPADRHHRHYAYGSHRYQPPLRKRKRFRGRRRR